MKTSSAIIIAFSLCLTLFAANAADRKHLEGPKGGRILEKTEPKAEFFIEKDGLVTITFYDANLKAIPAAGQQVSVVADGKAGKTRIEFERKGDVLVSKARLPEGDGYNLVVQLKQDAASKPQNFRFKLDLSTCGGCKRIEYACSCHE